LVTLGQIIPNEAMHHKMGWNTKYETNRGIMAANSIMNLIAMIDKIMTSTNADHFYIQ
jgi:hypothetical protein